MTNSKNARYPQKKINNLEIIYSKLRDRFGYLDWWPGDTKDEIVIGAILTQNTSWKNVEKAIRNLKQGDMLKLSKIANSNLRLLEKTIKPSGFYRQKAKRLKEFATYIVKNYKDINGLFKKEKDELRNELLSLNGIGMETADSMILYAAEKEVFVVDTYTKRILSRVYGIKREMDYEWLQKAMSKDIDEDLSLYKDFHAQFVELGKTMCKKEPLCRHCPINSLCNYYKNNFQGEKPRK